MIYYATMQFANIQLSESIVEKIKQAPVSLGNAMQLANEQAASTPKNERINHIKDMMRKNASANPMWVRQRKSDIATIEEESEARNFENILQAAAVNEVLCKIHKEMGWNVPFTNLHKWLATNIDKISEPLILQSTGARDSILERTSAVLADATASHNTSLVRHHMDVPRIALHVAARELEKITPEDPSFFYYSSRNPTEVLEEATNGFLLSWRLKPQMIEYHIARMISQKLKRLLREVLHYTPEESIIGEENNR